MPSSAQICTVGEMTREERIEERLAALERAPTSWAAANPGPPPPERTDVWHEIDVLRRQLQRLESVRVRELECEVYNLLTRPGYTHTPSWPAPEVGIPIAVPDWVTKDERP